MVLRYSPEPPMILTRNLNHFVKYYWILMEFLSLLQIFFVFCCIENKIYMIIEVLFGLFISLTY